MRARATSTARGRARAPSTARAGRAGDARRAGRAARRAEARGALADDLGAEDVLNAMESFCEEEESTRATPKTGGRARRDDVFRGTMDDDAFERLDKQKASRREKRTAVRAVREEAASGGARGGTDARLSFLYEEGVNVNDAGAVTKCNDVLRRCASMEEVLGLVKEMRDAGVEPVESTYVAVMLVCQNVGSPERAVQVYDAMTEAQVRMTGRTFHLAIELALKAEMFKDALRIKDDMRYVGLPVSSKLYVTLLRALADNDMGKRKGPQERLIRTCRLFEEMLNEDVDPAPAAYHTLIVAAHRANQHDLAVRTFDELIEEGITPSRQTYETALDSMARSGLLAQALEVFVQMKSNGLMPRKVTYNTLLSACVNAPQPRVEAAFEIFEEMQTKGNVTPDRSTYSLLIDAACKAGKPEMAFDAFSHMRDSGIEIQVGTLNRLIHAAGLNAKEDSTSVQATLELYDAMKKLGVEPDVITYGSLIATCAKARDAATAIKVYEEMRAAGVEPNRILFNVLINALGRANRSEEAMEYFRVMQKQSEVNSSLTPNRETYTTVFDAFIGGGGAELAMAKQSLESGDGASFVHSAQVAKLREIYAQGVEHGVYEDLSVVLSTREAESESCTINMNQLSRTEATVATLVLLERMSTLSSDQVPSAMFIYAGKVKPGKNGAQRRLLAIETVLRAANVKFEIGEVGSAELIAVKGKHCRAWIEKNAGTFV
jgi:pentatricopeptide repeat protein